MTERLFDVPGPVAPPVGPGTQAQAAQPAQRAPRPRKRDARTPRPPAEPLYTLRCAHGCGWTTRRRGLTRAITGFGEAMRCPGCHHAAAIVIAGQSR